MEKLREGKEYKFLVEKELILQDNSRHFVVKGPDSNKYLIPINRYSYYGICTGTEIKCKIDRINCRGEVFLEPRNPWYSEGKSYFFEVVGTDLRIDKSGTDHRVVVVTDKAGNRISVPHSDSDPFPDTGTRLRLTVERISKGKVHLVTFSGETTWKSLRVGSMYEFIIERIEKGMDDEEYYVVRDQSGNLHTIPREFYEYYGFSVGTRFRGRIIRYKKNGEKTIEPDNPFYKPGAVLKMEITGFVKNIINPSFTINLKDEFGFTHTLQSLSVPASRFVKCRVEMIKKGRPLVELL
jgi:hypothetical protein